VTYEQVFRSVQSNPQLRLLGEFLVTMLNTNEEATARVLGDIRIARRNNHWYVYGPTNQIDILIAPVSEKPQPPDPERVAMLTAIFDTIKEKNK